MYYNLKQLATECIYEIEAIGIPVTNVTPDDFTMNTRAKNRFGQCKTNICRSNGKRHYECKINISSFLLDSRNDRQKVKQTICHEIIHSLSDCIGDHHGKTWCSYVNRVNKAYGYHIQRCNTYEECLCNEVCVELKQIEKIKESKAKHITCECPVCGRTVCDGYYRRLPKWAVQSQHTYCNHCGKVSLGQLMVYVDGKRYYGK